MDFDVEIKIKAPVLHFSFAAQRALTNFRLRLILVSDAAYKIVPLIN